MRRNNGGAYTSSKEKSDFLEKHKQEKTSIAILKVAIKNENLIEKI